MPEKNLGTFANTKPCDGCGSKPTRVFYRKKGSEDLFLCEDCANSRYCRECHKLFDTEQGLKIHEGKVH